MASSSERDMGASEGMVDARHPIPVSILSPHWVTGLGKNVPGFGIWARPLSFKLGPIHYAFSAIESQGLALSAQWLV
jgi:hypothetical protein